ncbi:MAG: PIN domain protein [Bacteroidota bacterium]
MIKSAYLDTSVFGGYFDEEFSEDTIPFFDRIENENIKIIVSELLEEEINGAPNFVIELFEKIFSKNIQYVNITDEVDFLAESYIKEKVVGNTSFADCTHIALATINKADILASWNFKHIVNIDRIRGYNSVNLKLGYPILEIRTPREIFNYD